MNSKMINIYLSLPILSLFLIGCIFNMHIDGPDVISSQKAHREFYTIFLYKYFMLINFNAPLVSSDEGEADIGCNNSYNKYYYKDAVDHCKTVLHSINPDSIDSLTIQFIYSLKNICNLQSVNVFNEKKPFQGEIDTCSLIGK